MSHAIDKSRARRRLIASLCFLAAFVGLNQFAEPLGRRSVANAGSRAVVNRVANSVRGGGASGAGAIRHQESVRSVRRTPATTVVSRLTTTVPPKVTRTVAPKVTTTSPSYALPSPALPPHASISPGTSGSFEFHSYAALSDRPLKVWYDAPAGDLTAVKVIVVMHGQSRGGESYRDSWVSEARRVGALLVVPEFSEALYPGSEAYNLGNVNREPESRWSYSMIEPLFDYVRADTGNRSDGYYLYGHSAGAQFVHRFLFLVPNNRVKRAVVANAGWYTTPEPNIGFPYGMRESPVTDTGLRRALGKPLTILLGEDDTDSNDPDLRHSADADRQGPNRWARGHFFYQAGLNASRALGIPFGWTLQTVPGVAHSNADMVPAAARATFR